MATKQQIAQAKARAGGNNPIKVTNSGLSKLGKAALTAATFTPVGRVAKAAVTAAKPIAAAARNAAGKKVVQATMGKKSADAYAKAAAKRTADRVQTAKDLKTAKGASTVSPKSAVKVVPPKPKPDDWGKRVKSSWDKPTPSRKTVVFTPKPGGPGNTNKSNITAPPNLTPPVNRVGGAKSALKKKSGAKVAKAKTAEQWRAERRGSN